MRESSLLTKTIEALSYRGPLSLKLRSACLLRTRSVYQIGLLEISIVHFYHLRTGDYEKNRILRNIGWIHLR